MVTSMKKYMLSNHLVLKMTRSPTMCTSWRRHCMAWSKDLEHGMRDWGTSYIPKGSWWAMLQSQNRPIYKSTSTKAITEAIKPSYLSPYKSGSPMKPRRISNQFAYNQDRTWFNITLPHVTTISQIHRSSQLLQPKFKHSRSKVFLNQHQLSSNTCQYYGHIQQNHTYKITKMIMPLI